jgi:hypothetical protein
MKINALLFLIIGICLLGISCHDPNMGGDINGAKIILVGETHGVAWIYDIEFNRWKELYNGGDRHLFIEMAYYHGEFLNLWMRSVNDDILDDLFFDLKGTESHNQENIEFFKKIKSECPLTVFHGTDVGHQYWSTGERYLEYLIKNNLQDSERYILTLETMEQGNEYYNEKYTQYYRNKYRENTMAKNFIREYDKLKNERIMGIFGGAHTNYNDQAIYGNYPNMAKQLRLHYGNIIYFENYKVILE